MAELALLPSSHEENKNADEILGKDIKTKSLYFDKEKTPELKSSQKVLHKEVEISALTLVGECSPGDQKNFLSSSEGDTEEITSCNKKRSSLSVIGYKKENKSQKVIDDIKIKEEKDENQIISQDIKITSVYTDPWSKDVYDNDSSSKHEREGINKVVINEIDENITESNKIINEEISDMNYKSCTDNKTNNIQINRELDDSIIKSKSKTKSKCMGKNTWKLGKIHKKPRKNIISDSELSSKKSMKFSVKNSINKIDQEEIAIVNDKNIIDENKNKDICEEIQYSWKKLIGKHSTEIDEFNEDNQKHEKIFDCSIPFTDGSLAVQMTTENENSSNYDVRNKINTEEIGCHDESDRQSFIHYTPNEDDEIQNSRFFEESIEESDKIIQMETFNNLTHKKDSYSNDLEFSNSMETLNSEQNDDGLHSANSDQDNSNQLSLAEDPHEISSIKADKCIRLDNGELSSEYKLVSVSDFSLLPQQSNSEIGNKLEINTVKHIKQEKCEIPCEYTELQQWKMEPYQHNNNYVIRELFATIQNILSGSATIYKNEVQMENAFWKIENQNNGPIILIQKRENIDNDNVFIHVPASNDNEDTRSLTTSSSSKINQKTENSKKPPVKRCIVKLNRLPQSLGRSKYRRKAKFKHSTSTNADASKTEYQCNICSMKCHSHKTLLQHKCRYCNVCDKRFPALTSLYRHRKSANHIRLLKTLEETPKDNESTIEAQLDSKDPPAQDEIPEGFPLNDNEMAKRNISCNNCFRKFTSPGYLVKHKCRPNYCLMCKRYRDIPCKHLLDPKLYIQKSDIKNEAVPISKSSNESTDSKAVSSTKTDIIDESIKRTPRQVAQVTKTNIQAQLLDLDDSDSDIEAPHKKPKVSSTVQKNIKAESSSQNILVGEQSNQLTSSENSCVCQFCNIKYPNKLALRKHKMKNKCGFKQTSPIKDEIIESDDSDELIEINSQVSVESNYLKHSNLREPKMGKHSLKEENLIAPYRHKNQAHSSFRSSVYSDYNPSLSGEHFYYNDQSLPRYETNNFSYHMGSSFERHDHDGGMCGNLPFVNATNTSKNAKRFSCPYCYKMCFSYEQYKAHTRKHVTDDYYECPYCLKCFEHKLTLDRHIREHLRNKTYSCKQCGEQFTKYKLFYKHSLKH